MVVVVVQLDDTDEFERVAVTHEDCSIVVTEAGWVERLCEVLVDSLLLVVVTNWVSVGLV